MNLSSYPPSSTSRHLLAGILLETSKAGEVIQRRQIFAGQEIVIGRDPSRCQHTIEDPCVSKKHLRIYTIIYDSDNPAKVPPLVYAEDLSRNGTYCNGSLIGKRNGSFLLSNGDSLYLSSSTTIRFECSPPKDNEGFDLTQEDEMQAFHQEYVVTDRLLGAGLFGNVYMAINTSRSCQLACKIVDLRKLRPQCDFMSGYNEQPAQAEDVDNRVQLRKVTALADERKKELLLKNNLIRHYREADILGSINHPNIVGLEKVFVTDNTIYMFLELVTAGDLFSYLDFKNGRLLDVEAAVIVRQIVIALDYLHKRNIVHRDIKPDNILMTTLAAGCRVVLTDFGLARRIASPRQRMISFVGTAEYTAPEVIGKSPDVRLGYGKAIDMWSLGCVTVLLLTGRYAFKDPQTNQHCETLAKNCNLAALENSREWSEVSARPKAFVGRLLLLKESQRLSAKDALQDPWFNNEFHKKDFEDLYKRSIRHWQPRAHKEPIIEFRNAYEVKKLPCSQEILAAGRRTQARPKKTPVDPPYKPYPRQMHKALFMPQQPSSASNKTSLEVRSTTKEHLTSCGSSEESSVSDTATHTDRTQDLQPQKPAVKPLIVNLAHMQTTSRPPSQTDILSSLCTSNELWLLESIAASAGGVIKSREGDVADTSRSDRGLPATPRPEDRGASWTSPLPVLSTTALISVSYGPTKHPFENHLEAPSAPESRTGREVNNHNNNDASLDARSPLGESELMTGPTTRPLPSLSPSSATKAKSSLRLRTLAYNNTKSLPASRSKRRRISIYEMDGIETIEASKSISTQWQPIQLATARAVRRIRSYEDAPGEESSAELTSAFFPRTLSASGEEKSIYLPRV